MNSIDYRIFKNAFIFIYIFLLVIIASIQHNIHFVNFQYKNWMFKIIFLCVRLLLRWQNAISFAASNSNLPAFRRFDMTTWIIHLNPPQKQEQQQAETDSATRNARKVQCTQPQNPDFDQLKKTKEIRGRIRMKDETISRQLQEMFLTKRAAALQQCISFCI